LRLNCHAIAAAAAQEQQYHYNIFTSTIRTFNTRITEYSTTMRPPRKEGLEVKVDVTVLYHIKPDAAPSIYENVGVDYGNTIVINNFMAIVREYTMQYTAVELFGERATIEKNIEDQPRKAISPYEIVLDDVLQIDADAIKNYQNIISPSITYRLLKYKSLEVSKELVRSHNAKVIITNGKSMMLNTIGDK